MLIEKDTPLDDLWALRHKFSPRWATESKKVRIARKTLTGDALKRAKQDYADFETVGSAVIQIVELRTELAEAQATILDLQSQLSVSTDGVPDTRPDTVPVENVEASRPTGFDSPYGRCVRDMEYNVDLTLANAEKYVDHARKAARNGLGFQMVHGLEHAVDMLGVSMRAWASSDSPNLRELTDAEFRRYQKLDRITKLCSLFASCEKALACAKEGDLDDAEKALKDH